MLFKLIVVACAVGMTFAQPAGYDHIPGVGFYKYHASSAGWLQAVDICASEGGHLFIINSQSEVDAVYQLYANLGVWVGVKRVDRDNYVTIFDEPLSSTGYSTWYPGFPRKRRRGRTMRNKDFPTWPWVGASGNQGLYNLFSTVILPFICESKLE